MKRTDLIALADAVESQAEDWKDDTDARALARFARQIAQAQPSAWTNGSGPEDRARVILRNAPESYGYDPAKFWPLYTLPLED